MSKYKSWLKNPSRFISMTGYTIEDFNRLLPYFEEAHDQYLSKHEISGKKKSGFRRFVIYQSSPLPSYGDRLCFILFYFKHKVSFSPLGDRMVRYYPNEDIQLLEFDRETGTFVNYSTFKLDVGTSLAFAGGCSFSPNGQFLYVAALTNIYQFDMAASDISATQTTVATWDGFVDPIAISFLNCQLGPDCKIYILGGGDTKYYISSTIPMNQVLPVT